MLTSKKLEKAISFYDANYFNSPKHVRSATLQGHTSIKNILILIQDFFSSKTGARISNEGAG